MKQQKSISEKYTQLKLQLLLFKLNLHAMLKSSTNTTVGAVAITQEELFDTPLLPAHVYDKLPKLLMKGCELMSPDTRERDVFFTSSLALISGSLPNYYVHYDDHKVHMNLFTMVVAPPASGKGVVSLAGAYIKGIEAHLLEEYNAMVKLKEVESPVEGDEGNVNNSKRRKLKLPRKRHVIPANSSAASFMGILNENGGIGTIYETEADTLAQSFKQDWGNFSDLLRKSFHHESTSSSRKTDDAHLVIERPQVSVLLAGTPQQVGSMGLANPENGLQSRFIFYYFDSLPFFKMLKGRKDDSRDVVFAELSNEMLDIYLQLHYNEEGAQFVLTDPQWAFFSNWYKFKMETVSRKYNGYTSAMVKRTALVTIRIAGILSMLYQSEEGMVNFVDKVHCSWQTLRKSLAIADVYLAHNLVIFSCSAMSAPDVDMHQYLDFYSLLPEGEFDRKDVLEICAAVGFSERTLDRRLEKLRKSGKLYSAKGGTYKKAKK